MERATEPVDIFRVKHESVAVWSRVREEAEQVVGGLGEIPPKEFGHAFSE